jgi:3-methyladenine DNA glycosylase AlkC
MAEPLKNQFGPAIPRTIGRMIAAVFPAFDEKAFVKRALKGYDALELMARGRKIAEALRQHLPADYPRAAEMLIASLDQRPVKTAGQSMTSFLFLPHVLFVAEYGLDHFDVSMRAQHALTKLFTAEFSIRRYLERHQAATLARLKEWAADPSADVRRLVSEGTRPRLPWAIRLRAFQADPSPVLALLELLKDDPDLYVRRSVANNLSDIGKDHPAVLITTARKWMVGATEERRWIVRHALRSAVKRAESGALDLLGFGHSAEVVVQKVRIAPRRAAIGSSVTLACELRSKAATVQRLLVDLRVRYIKANGTHRPKVFKLKTVELASRESLPLNKTLSLMQLTTRKHYPGTHHLELMVNGRAYPLGSFELWQR